MEMNKEEWIKGIRSREKELKEKWQKFFDSKGAKDKETERYDAFYTCYGLFGDCLEFPHKTRLEHVNTFIVSIKQYLKPNDLGELRELYKTLAKDLDVIMGNELGGKRVDNLPKREIKPPIGMFNKEKIE